MSSPRAENTNANNTRRPSLQDLRDNLAAFAESGHVRLEEGFRETQVKFGEVGRRSQELARETLHGQKARRGSLFSAAPGVDTKHNKSVHRAKLLGALSFFGGSVAFACQVEWERKNAGQPVLESSWLWWGRIGCLLWIPGCFAYLLAPFFHTVKGDPSLSGKVSDTCQCIGMICFIAGSLLYFGGQEQDVYARFFLINRFFLWGCILILVDALKTTYSAFVTSGIGIDNVLDLATTSIFLAAALLGGHYLQHETPFSYQLAMLGWFIGSGLCVIGPLRSTCRPVEEPRTPLHSATFPPDEQSALSSADGLSDSEPESRQLLVARQPYGGLDS